MTVMAESCTSICFFLYNKIIHGQLSCFHGQDRTGQDEMDGKVGEAEGMTSSQRPLESDRGRCEKPASVMNSQGEPPIHAAKVNLLLNQYKAHYTQGFVVKLQDNHESPPARCGGQCHATAL